MTFKTAGLALTLMAAFCTTQAQAHYSYKPSNYEINLYNPFTVHYLKAIFPNQVIQLTDGSEWVVDNDSFNSLIREDWRVNDRIQIRQGYNLSLSRSSNTEVFELRNLDQGYYVTGYLDLGAFPEKRHVIADIDYNAGWIQLANGMVFNVGFWSSYKIANWNRGDDVIMGTDRYGWSYKDFILINVPKNKFVCAHSNN
jgi:hypothetical protein